MDRWEEFMKYKKRHEKRIKKSFAHIYGTRILFVYDIEKTLNGTLFTAEFSNGEMLRLFTHGDVSSDYRDKGVAVDRLMFNGEEDMVVLKIGNFGGRPWYILDAYL